MVDKFAEQRQSEFKMSMVGEMSYFLGLQVKQKLDGIFISQSKYASNLVKKFDLEKAAHKRTLGAIHVKITKDEAGASVDQTLYKSRGEQDTSQPDQNLDEFEPDSVQNKSGSGWSSGYPSL
ncbi:unnamed protein product [Rhodiola kirilowii]